MVGICGAQTTNWTPAVRGGRMASSAENPARPEAMAQDLFRSGLVLWVPAHTSQTAAAWDYSGLLNDCTNVAQSVFPTWTTNGGGSYRFSNTNAMQTPPMPTSIATVVTVSVWTRLTNAIGVAQFPISSHLNDVGVRSCFGIRLTTTQTWSIVTGNNSANSIPETGQIVPFNVWQFLTFVNSNGLRQFYVDGVQIISISNSSWGSIGTTSIVIGATSPHTAAPRYWQGDLDNWQVCTNALSSNQIFQLAWGPTNFGQRRAHNK